MNLVQLSMLLSPLLGCIAGVSASSSQGGYMAVLGGFAGLLCGALIFALMLLVGGTAVRFAPELSEQPLRLEWVAGVFFMLCVGAAPFAGFFVTAWSVNWLL